MTVAQSAMDRILKTYPNWRTDFTKKSIDLEELIAGGPPKDGIPALTNPKFISIDDAGEWLKDNEPLIALEVNGITKGYPLQILIWHEIVNDEINDVPVIATFCPLCYSAIVFDRRVGTNILTFGVSGLLRNSDMVMYDLYTESFWQQFTGEAIVGDMLDNKLKSIPSQILSFKQLKQAYPDATILSRETGYERRYGMNPYYGYDDIEQTPFLYNGETDDRLPPNEKVIAVKEEGYMKAYPYSISYEKKVIHDTIGSKAVVVFHAEGTASALDQNIIANSKDVGSTGVYSPIINGKQLTFFYREGNFIDNETGSSWDITGRAIQGKLQGTRLTKLPHGDYFAFAWLAFMPHTEVYTAE